MLLIILGPLAADYTPAAAAAGDSRRIGWRRQYVSDRQHHSSGPKRNRASHQRLHSSLKVQIPATT
jgi:hypothetical protein